MIDYIKCFPGQEVGESMKRFLTLGIILVTLLIFTQAASARTFLVMEFAAEGIDEPTVKLVTSLIRSEIAGQTTAIVKHVSGKGCYDEACGTMALKSENADMALVGKIVQIGDRPTLHLLAVWPKETIRYAIFMTEIGEINRLAPRLAKAVVDKSSFEDAVSTKTVSEEEEEIYKRVKGDFSWGPMLGTLIPIGNSYGGGVNALFTIDLVFRYETDHFGYEFDTGIYFNAESDDHASAYEWPLDFAFMYYFVDGKNSPIVGGSLGLHLINVTTSDEWEENHRGWTTSASVFGGYELLRTHNFHVMFKGGYRFGLIALDGRGAHGPFVNIAFTF
jgi:hypothetical protein